MITFIATKNEKLTEYLKSMFLGELSYSNILTLLKNKDVKVNGKRVNKDIEIKTNDEIAVYTNVVPKIEIAYKDENILIANKPQNIEVIDFIELIKREYSSAVLCHRLDRNTQGLLVCALNEVAEKELLNAFKNRTIDKYYIAEVYKKPKKEQDVLVNYLVKDEKNSIVKIYDKKVNDSCLIKTEYKVLSYKENTSILEVKLLTGKTHQIRAHLSYIGNFIIGDTKYGDNKINSELNAKRQRLVAYKIVFNFEKDSVLYYLNDKKIQLENLPF